MIKIENKKCNFSKSFLLFFIFEIIFCYSQDNFFSVQIQENAKKLKERYDAVEEKLKHAKYIELKLEEQQMVIITVFILNPTMLEYSISRQYYFPFF